MTALYTASRSPVSPNRFRVVRAGLRPMNISQMAELSAQLMVVTCGVHGTYVPCHVSKRSYDARAVQCMKLWDRSGL